MLYDSDLVRLYVCVVYVCKIYVSTLLVYLSSALSIRELNYVKFGITD